MADFKPGDALPEGTPFRYLPGTELPEGTSWTPAPSADRGYIMSALSGLGAGLWKTAGGAGVLAGAIPTALDTAHGMVSGKPETGLQDWWFKNVADAAKESARPYELSPEDSGNIGKAVLHGVGEGLPMIAGAALSGMAGLPGLAALAPYAGAQAAATGAEMLEKGTDLPTAFKSAAISGAGNIAMGALPVSMAGGVLKRAATGALSGVVTNEAQREAQNAVLGNYENLKTPFTAQNAIVGGLTGALMGTLLGPRSQKGQQIDAAAAEVQQDLASLSKPGEMGAALPVPEVPVAPPAVAPEVVPATTRDYAAEARAEIEATKQRWAAQKTPEASAENPGLSALVSDVFNELYAGSDKAPQKGFVTRIQKQVAEALDGLDTPEAKITKLTEMLPKNGGPVHDIYSSLIEKLTPEKAPDETAIPQTAEAFPPAAQGETPVEIGRSPAPAPAVTEPTKTGAPESVATRNPLLSPERAQVMAQAQDTKDTLKGLLAEYGDRLKAKEAIPEVEHDRYDHMATVLHTLEQDTNPTKSPAPNERLLSSIVDAQDFLTPEAWAKNADKWQERVGKASTSSDAPSVRLMEMSDTLRPVGDYLDLFVRRGSTEAVRSLATKLQEFDLPTTISKDKSTDYRAGYTQSDSAWYDSNTNTIGLTDRGASENTVLHEIVHAATFHVIDWARSIIQPRNQREAILKDALQKWESLRKEVLRRVDAEDHYGLTNAQEFMAELHTNPEFQSFLAKKSLWNRAVDTVRDLMGLPAKYTTALEKAMDLQKEFFGKEQYQAAAEARMQAREFDASPQGAAKVTDEILPRVLKKADEESKYVDWARANLEVFGQFLPWQTKQFIADRVRAIPALRDSGLAQWVDAFNATDKSRSMATTYTAEAASKFIDTTHRALAKLSDAARERASNMAGAISVGSSIGRFDPTMNYADNIKAGMQPTASAAAINKMYGQYVQLKASAPEVAAAITEGAKANRHDLAMKTATVVDQILKRSTGADYKLEMELGRMDPAVAAIERAKALAGAASTDEQALAQAWAGKLDFGAKDVREAKLDAADAGHFYDGASAEMNRRLLDLFALADHLPADSDLRGQLSEIGRTYVDRMSNAYYHAGREGDSFVNVAFKNMDDATWGRMGKALEGSGRELGDYAGQDKVFIKVDGLARAQALREKLVAAAGDKVDMEHTIAGLTAKEARLSSNSGISAAMRAVMDKLTDSVDQLGLDSVEAAALKDVVMKNFISLLPETSVKAVELRRQGVPGYDTDFLGTFARHALNSTRDTANLYTMHSYAQAIKGMTDSVARLAGGMDIDMQARGNKVRDEILKRYNDSMKPVDNSIVNLINSYGHSYYLALAPAFFIRTFAQPWHRGLPYVGGRYGFVNAAAEMAGATGTALKIIGNSIRGSYAANGMEGVRDAKVLLDGLDLKPNEATFVKEMVARGTLDFGQASQLSRMAMTGSPRMQAAARYAAMTAQYAEMSNRLITGIAAFRLAEKGSKGLLGDQSLAAHIDYAEKAINYVMDDFTPSNTARAIGKHGVFGPVTPLATAFMNYNLQTMQQIARTVHDGMFSKDMGTLEGRQLATEAQKEFAGLMVTTAMISGALGLPFVNAFAGLYNTIMDVADPDSPGDIREGLRNSLANTFGVKVGEAMAHGPLQALTHVSTDSFGMQNLLPGSDFLSSRQLFKDRMDELPKTLAGPALNAGMDFFAAGNKIVDGQYVKGIEQALPAFLKGPWKAGELATRGLTDTKGNPLGGVDVTPWDIAIQSTGLRPAKLATRAEANNQQTAMEARVANRKGIVEDRIFKGIRYDNPDATKAAFENAAAFSKANPMQAIRDVPGMLREKYMREALSGVTGGVAVSKKQLPVFQQRVQYLGGGMP